MLVGVARLTSVAATVAEAMQTTFACRRLCRYHVASPIPVDTPLPDGTTCVTNVFPLVTSHRCCNEQD